MRPIYAERNSINNNNIELYEVLLFAKHFDILSVFFIALISVAFCEKYHVKCGRKEMKYIQCICSTGTIQ